MVPSLSRQMEITNGFFSYRIPDVLGGTSTLFSTAGMSLDAAFLENCRHQDAECSSST